MGRVRWSAWLCIVAAGLYPLASAQSKPKITPNPTNLLLTAEVATTSDDGHPSVLRITLKNVGSVTVTLPVMGESCAPDNGVDVRMTWTSDDPENPGGGGFGGGCAAEGGATVAERARKEWIRLRPGEFMTTSRSLRSQLRDFKPGTIEYWVEYTPPTASPEEVGEPEQAGYIIPTEKLETEHWSFTLR